jgi:flotillin
MMLAFLSFLSQASVAELWPVAMVILAVVVLFSLLMLVVKRYKRCPSNKVLVIYGKVRDGRSAKTLHGGGAFVWPLIQSYEYLSLDPIQIEIPLKGALSMENIRVNVPSVFTVAIGTDGATMQNAAIRLLGLGTKEIMKQAEDIIFGQLRQVIASMRIEDINRDRDKFLSSIQESLEPELEKIGLVLINVNITDITDESGYIEAIGRKAASEAIQQAAIDVADQEKRGAIGVALAQRERAVSVADAAKEQEIGTKQAERAQRVAVSDADAKAVAGENLAKAEIADANAQLAVKQADAFKIGETRRREADAAVREAQYNAEVKAAEALSRKIEQEKRAELEAVARAAKAKAIVDAEAAAERRRIEAQGEADAIFAKLEAQARGEYEVLAKKGEALKQIVEGCGGPQAAFQLLVLEHLEKLSENAASAIRNVKFDKVVVWDGGNGAGTAGFLRGLGRALPPMLDIMRDVGGIELPGFLGKVADANGPPEKDEKTEAASVRSRS